MKYHESVLLKESVENLVTTPSGKYFEGTIGFGGHSEKILEKLNADAMFIGTDKDKKAFEFCVEKFKSDSRVSLYNAGFTNIGTISKIEFIDKFDGIFLDLGISSYQIDDSEAGFTFREEADLDLRMDKKSTHKASDIINYYEEKEIADIIYKYGEEKNSRAIARRIIEKRNEGKINSTLQLAKIIEEVTNPRFVNKTLTRVFQALRIFVNNELEELKIFLSGSISLLKTGGRLCIITFHSLEDRIVKEFFKYENLSCVCSTDSPVCICSKVQTLKIITRKPITPSEEELGINKRSRSAKLRVAERI
ncbi:MAG: 16S rRNA (cytosine(1402)-N(4))-methyltransferase RsmH [Bacteroidetes bacterium]|nr:16S rRNA (cytosine(1402)-N(4))-methyltransferase RsmH [Bacteroidota bacterium]MBU2506324.1 16S rRNA (cytosine(1402)-N(4))-methyltransferase RsmH [Bacteroidota bacterium]